MWRAQTIFPLTFRASNTRFYGFLIRGPRCNRYYAKKGITYAECKHENKCQLPFVKHRRRRTFSLTWNGKVENSFITRRLFCRKNSLIKWHNYTHILKSSTIILLPSSPQLNKSYFLSVCPNGNNFVSNYSRTLFFFYHKPALSSTINSFHSKSFLFSVPKL